MIKYLGSKRLLLPAILEVVGSCSGARTVLDLFSGTSRVGHALKGAGYRVIANDITTYAHTLATCYVVADSETHGEAAAGVIAELNRLPGAPGYFTQTFCEDARYLQPFNGARVDAMREQIERLSLDPCLQAVVLTSLIEAADRVDSTTGVQMAYLKQWSARSHNPIELRLPRLLSRSPHGPGEAMQRDALEAAASPADVAYIDPPYNQHSYLGNYHMWESLARWDKPETYGVANKRVDCRTRGSAFNRKRGFEETFARLIAAVQAPIMVVSFSNEGFMSPERMTELLAGHGEVTTHRFDYKRYVGAQIGIHNPAGEKVGQVSHLRNEELLFVVRR